jgi:CspA family cold shock protein
MDGYKSLKEGARVDFDLSQGPKGLLALNIRAEGAAPMPPSDIASPQT